MTDITMAILDAIDGADEDHDSAAVFKALQEAFVFFLSRQCPLRVWACEMGNGGHECGEDRP